MLCYRKHPLFTKKYQIFRNEQQLIIGESLQKIKYAISLNLSTVIDWSFTKDQTQLNGFSVLVNSQEKFFAMDAKSCELLKNSLGGLVSYRKYQQFYEPINLVSNGCFGSKIKMKSKLQDEFVICKTIKKSLQYTLEDFQYQLGIMNNLFHQNIQKIKEIYWNNKSFHIITEYPKGGSLNDLIKYQQLGEIDIIQIMRLILKTLQYIHEKGYIHRDLKPDNILFMDNNKFEELVISEFEFACFKSDALIKYSRILFRNPICGTHGFMAPEVKLKKYDQKCDIFSCGVIFYQLLTKRELFDNDSYLYDEQLMLHLLDHSNVDDKFIYILKKMLNFNPVERINIEECLILLNEIESFTPQRSLHILDELDYQTSLNDEIISFADKSNASVLSSHCIQIQTLPVFKIKKKLN